MNPTDPKGERMCKGGGLRTEDPKRVSPGVLSHFVPDTQGAFLGFRCFLKLRTQG